MQPHYTIPDLDRVIRFGNRMNNMLDTQGPSWWTAFTRYYFPISKNELEKYMTIARNEELAKKIFKNEPLLSINGLIKTIENEISGN